jgi:4-carboxymuconolactone decarboxylase
MSRIPTASRENVPQDQLAAFDALVASRGSVPDIGPVAIMINGPELASRGENYRAYFRGDEITLEAPVRELAMILTARNAHSGYARQAGVSDKLVDDLRDKKELTGLSDKESAVINYGREFFRTHKVSQATFDAAQAQFGTLGLVELTNLMGYYSALAFNINAFDVGLPDTLTELPLPI